MRVIAFDDIKFNKINTEYSTAHQIFYSSKYKYKIYQLSVINKTICM